MSALDGYTYTEFADVAPVTTGTYHETEFAVDGFTSDPGQGWLVSASIDGVTETGVSATYAYFASTGKATWVWTNGPIMPDSGNWTCTIIHF